MRAALPVNGATRYRRDVIAEEAQQELQAEDDGQCGEHHGTCRGRLTGLGARYPVVDTPRKPSDNEAEPGYQL